MKWKSKELSETVAILSSTPFRLQQASTLPPLSLGDWRPLIYLFAPVEEAGPYLWLCLSVLWWPVLCVWSQDISSGTENGEGNELEHTLAKGWCTDSQGSAHVKGKEQNKDCSKRSFHPLGWTWWKNLHLNLKESAGDWWRRIKKCIRTLKHVTTSGPLRSAVMLSSNNASGKPGHTSEEVHESPVRYFPLIHYNE